MKYVEKGAFSMQEERVSVKMTEECRHRKAETQNQCFRY